MSTKAGIRPDAASTMMRPVGVGLTSRGPIGVDGLTITAGRPIAQRPSPRPDAQPRPCCACRRRSRPFRRAAHPPSRGAVPEPERRDAARVDDALDARFERLLHDEPRSLDIVAADLVRVFRPEPVIGGGVEEEPDALERARERGAVGEIALAQRVAGIEIRARARGAREHADVVAALAQRGGDRRADKAARAGDQHGRGLRLGFALGRHGDRAGGSGPRRGDASRVLTIHGASLPNRGAASKRALICLHESVYSGRSGSACPRSLQFSLGRSRWCSTARNSCPRCALFAPSRSSAAGARVFGWPDGPCRRGRFHAWRVRCCSRVLKLSHI